MLGKSSHAFAPPSATTVPRQIAVWGILVFATLFAIQASAAQISVAWNASPSASVTGYKLYYGQASGNYTTSNDVGNNLSYTVGGLTSGQTYYFAVTAYDATGAQSAFSNEAAGTAPAATAADFSASPTSGTAPVTVTFVNKSTGATSYSWNFGDSGSTNNTSTAITPTHTYNNAGAYTVTLNATGADGTKTKTLTNYITVSAPAVSANQAPTGTIISPSTDATVVQGSLVTFQGTGTDPDNNMPLTYSWNFGSGATPSTATVQNPTVTFNTAGTYTVSLTVTDSKGLAAVAPATQVVTVTPPTSATSTKPVANADSYTVQAGTTLRVAAPGVLSNDTSPTGKALTAKGLTSIAPGTGSLRFYSSGRFIFTPATGFVGTVTFTYTSNDGTTTSSPATVTINVIGPAGGGGTAGTTSGLVAAFGFREGSGTTVADSSGKGNTGTISNATWTSSGRFGNALKFNGTNASVTVPDSASLDLTNGMTLEAWVYPQGSLGGWRSIVMKEQPGSDVYYIETVGGKLVGDVFVGGSTHHIYSDSPIALNRWTHLAATYNGALLRIYIDGNLATIAQNLSGAIQASSGALRIGANAIWGEYFQGVIDEVRVYNRALSADEIRADMNTAVAP